MLAKVSSGAVLGVDAFPISVEVDLALGVPGFSVVGLGDLAVQESKERVRAAVRNSGYEFPPRRDLGPIQLGHGTAIVVTLQKNLCTVFST